MTDNDNKKEHNKIYINYFKKYIRDEKTGKRTLVETYSVIENYTREFVEKKNKGEDIYLFANDIKTNEEMQFIVQLVLKYGITTLDIATPGLNSANVVKMAEIFTTNIIEMLHDVTCKVENLYLGFRSVDYRYVRTDTYRPLLRTLQKYGKLTNYYFTKMSIDFIVIIEYFLMVYLNNIKDIRSTCLHIRQTVSADTRKKYADKLVSYISNKQYASITIDWRIHQNDTFVWLAECIFVGILYNSYDFTKISVKIDNFGRYQAELPQEYKNRLSELVKLVEKKYEFSEIKLVT